MKKRSLTTYLTLGLAAAAMAAAVTAPAEVINNLDFFSDYELISNLEILEDGSVENGAVADSTATLSVSISSETVKASTVTAEGL
ncbi:MAG: hypothetical protein A2X35_07535 [Elusimicrobia bacterium GWA2_61_42]|nr:MAG: hypothetical protein A2X35_07535 [Elusimicrobia bacterium GWA2_61_42]OGR77929.1 MAG: hypothetical protein A2X38_10565 [Elusimicrobia bacterium GWC2_61_25]